jgi:O-antigen/teichoic acid export membrane protein
VIVTGVLVARTLGPEQRGEWALFLATTVLAAKVLSLGLVQALSIDAGKLRRPLFALHQAGLLLGLGGAAVALLAFLGVAGLFGPRSISSLGLLGTTLALALVGPTLYGMVSDALLAVRGDVAALNSLKCAQAALHLIFALVALVAFGGGLFALITAHCAASLVLVGLRLTRLPLRGAGAVGESFGGLIAALPHAWPIYRSFLLAALLDQVDVFVLAKVAASREVGIYAVAAALATRGLAVAGAVLIAATARLTAADAEDADGLAARLTRTALCATVLVVPLSALVARPLMTGLYGPAFAAAGLPLVFLTAAAGLRAVTGVAALHLINQRERPGPTVAANLAALLIGVPAHWVLGRAFGALGAAAASLLTAAIQSGYLLVEFRRAVRLPWRDVLWCSRADLAAGATSVRRLVLQVRASGESS